MSNFIEYLDFWSDLEDTFQQALSEFYHLGIESERLSDLIFLGLYSPEWLFWSHVLWGIILFVNTQIKQTKSIQQCLDEIIQFIRFRAEKTPSNSEWNELSSNQWFVQEYQRISSKKVELFDSISDKKNQIEIRLNQLQNRKNKDYFKIEQQSLLRQIDDLMDGYKIINDSLQSEIRILSEMRANKSVKINLIDYFDKVIDSYLQQTIISKTGQLTPITIPKKPDSNAKKSTLKNDGLIRSNSVKK